MPVTLDQGEAFCLVHLDGPVNITSAADLKKLLLQALESGKDLRVDLELATELDVTILQLLWAAERKAAGSGTGCTLSGRVPPGVSDAVLNAGFEKFPVPSDQK